MISLWSAGLWLLEAVFKILDRFLTPDVTDPGLVDLYGITLWISLVVALRHRLRPDRAGRASAATAPASAPCSSGSPSTAPSRPAGSRCSAALVLASAGLTTGLLHGILDIDGFAGYPAGAGWPDQVGGTVGRHRARAVLPVPAHPRRLRLPADHAGARRRPADPHRHRCPSPPPAPWATAPAPGCGSRLRWFLAACLTAPAARAGPRPRRPDHPRRLPRRPHDRLTRSSRPVPLRHRAGLRRPSTRPTLAPPAGRRRAARSRPTRIIGEACPAHGQPGRHGRRRRRHHGRRLLLPDGAVPAARLRRPRHRLRRLLPLHPRRQRRRRRPAHPAGAATDRPGAATQTAPDGRAASEQAADAETANRFQSAAARAVPGRRPGVAGTMRLLGGSPATAPPSASTSPGRPASAPPATTTPEPRPPRQRHPPAPLPRPRVQRHRPGRGPGSRPPPPQGRPATPTRPVAAAAEPDDGVRAPTGACRTNCRAGRQAR